MARLWPFLALLALALLLPLTGNEYWALIATRACIYWVLVAGLNLIVGFAGQLAIGYVALLAIGAYTASVFTAGTVMEPLPAFVALGIAAAAGAVAGVVVGLPALRLRTFYFAMTTLGFATIVTQITLAWQDVTGGGIGIPGPALPAPMDTAWGFYYFCLALAVVCTWATANLARSRFGRALVAIRDSEVAAEASGIAKPRLLVMIFLFAGALAAFAGGLFATLQTYITPDAFTFDLSLLFFIAILIGGRGSILGPLLGTILLTLLPEVAAPLAAWSTFLYAALLLVIVLAMPGGIAALIDRSSRRPLPEDRTIRPRAEALATLIGERGERAVLSLRGIVLAFGGVRAIDGLDLDLRQGEVHGLIGPNGSGKTTTLNVISGYYRPQAGSMAIGTAELPVGQPEGRAGRGIARTFQTPRMIGEATVLENVMIGATIEGRAGFLEAMLSLPRQRAEERVMAERARLALEAVGLAGLAGVRADRLQHSELRFMEIARALMLRPEFLMLDEPAAGLSVEEIKRLGALIRAVSRRGVGVLLVEHHADLIFDICDQVTVLNLGRVLAAGTPAEIRVHKEVVSAYLGA
ncbi:branched-chain amino acid ABC transporter ATP-binding protein/permease [Belnapia rosea]|uniref:Amino acid/amide ABC transporter membrane protein 2, HAAT family /amino acid/amide ABC transporter ATP-binding protein 1, HAAT family n=1 Tax=Belnapia rosea TaxID=938405 RepID=A0A1G6KSV1_9PROT|nr:branched-chain amino acid ABC transporter ATP-binding protein/permease [Belnapia rosea]SDC33898.1 amino acid/amide ABC transporter membrane protein 2, HAAT family /amino acid/amide ABC transporter ATP-binding protein 1, HAAT family [Belnapia rosea]